MKWSSRDYLIAFNMMSGIGQRRLASLEEAFGTLETAWNCSKQDLLSVPGFGDSLVATVTRQRQQIDPLQEQKRAARLGINIVTSLDAEYPEGLRVLDAKPPVIYYRGILPLSLGIAVVGSRKPSATGKQQAYRFSQEIAKHGLPVVSGLARGIDTQAHLGTLAVNGYTIAVLGSPLNTIYPPENSGLAQKIAATGCLMSEYSLDMAVHPGNFPQRNRIISGLSFGVLVVEAGERSGAISTASHASEQGRDVWAIPGEIHHPLRKGTNRLIKDGAGLVEAVEDIVSSISSISPLSVQKLDKISQDVLEYSRQGCSPQQILEYTGLSVQKLFSLLSTLEISGYLDK